jgi:hypothetical protein
MDFRSQPLKFSIKAFGKIHPTIIAGFEGHWNIVRLLLTDERTDIPILRNMDGWLLRLACMNNQADAVKMILEDRDLRVNQLNHQGRMPWFPYVFGPHKKSHLLINYGFKHRFIQSLGYARCQDG